MMVLFLVAFLPFGVRNNDISLKRAVDEAYGPFMSGIPLQFYRKMEERFYVRYAIVKR